MKALVIEDDGKQSDYLRIALGKIGIASSVEEDGESGLSAILAGGSDIVLLDIRLPRMNGIDVVRAAKAAGNTTPIILLTAEDDISTRCAGLDAGADDYLPKPFSFELVALSNAFDRLFRLQQKRLRETEELASAVLHDLRTPLTHIRNETELAYHHAKPASDAIGEIAEACDGMLEAIEMDAEISRASLGLAGGSAEPVDVAQVVDRCLDIYLPVAEAKSIALDYRPSPTPLSIQGHPCQIQRVLSNLLDNAIKYTPEHGRIVLETKAAAGFCRISVSDTGIGIAADDLPKVFRRFYRADVSRREPGHGLGLALVAAIAEAHHGRTSVNSMLGAGSTFTVELPLSDQRGASGPPDAPRISSFCPLGARTV